MVAKIFESAREINKQCKRKSRKFEKLYRQPGTEFRKQTVMKPKTVRTKNPISTWCLLRMLLPLLLVWFGFPSVRAVTPPPDGGYGTRNTAEGTDSLFSLTTGAWNSAFGFRALYRNATAVRNTALGYQALYNTNGPYNVSGLDNVAVGANALFNNTVGNSNIAIGSYALFENTTGSNNIAIGTRALRGFNGSGNTVVGDSFASGSDFASIGRPAVTDCRLGLLSDGIHYASIYAETDVEVGEYLPSTCPNTPDLTTQTVHINAKDAVYVMAVYGNPIAGSPVTIDSNNQLGVAPSSKRFKTDIRPMDEASEAVLALRPVTFRYKEGIDPDRMAQFGLVAEEVEKVDSDLVSRDAKGKPYSVRYDAVNAMLLNEFIKEHRKVEELEANAAEQQKQIKALAGIVKQQASLLEKVSSQLEASKVTPKIVAGQ